MPNPENIVKHQFKKGQSGNVNGRPPQLVAKITKELQKLGYKPATKAHIIDAYLTLIQLPYEKIVSIAERKGDTKDYAFLYAKVAESLISEGGSEALEKILDRAIGKATQNTDITTKGDKLETQIVVASKEVAEETLNFINDVKNEEE
jgi:hypothetical protein